MRSRLTTLAAASAAMVMGVAAASASAEEFGASAEGPLKSAGGEQVLTVKNGTETLRVECEKVEDSGTTKLKSQTQKVNVTYKECFTAGSSVNNIEAEYEFNAGGEKVAKGPAKGTVSVLKAISITTKTSTICKLTVPAQTTLGSIEYKEVTKTHGKAIEINAKVTGITSENASGSLKPCNYSKNTEGTYTGLSESWLEGGSLELLA